MKRKRRRSNKKNEREQREQRDRVFVDFIKKFVLINSCIERSRARNIPRPSQISIFREGISAGDGSNVILL